MTVRVVFADDNYLVREGVAGLLTETPEVDLVETVGDPVALHEAVARHQPDAVLTDIRMPPTFTTEGIAAAKRIRVEFPQIGVVVLSQYVEEDYAFELLAGGVAGMGYLLKERVSDVAVLADALRRIGEGECVVDPTIVARLVARKRARGPLDVLTEREREVLALIAEGLSNKAISERMYLSPKTVEAHISQIFMKLDLRTAEGQHRRVLAVLAYLRAS